MKITFRANMEFSVIYDKDFKQGIYDESLDTIVKRVEDTMWDHSFKRADILDDNTGEVLVTIEREY